MTTTPIKLIEGTYGTPVQRLAFIRYLRDTRGFTLEELATLSMYSPDTVKAWFSDNPKRYRVCPERAVSLVLANLRLTTEAYWVIVNAA